MEHSAADRPGASGDADAPTTGPRLTRTRCFIHASRAAVARCPRCGRYFCRECVTEHEGRVICASCLRRLTEPARRRLGGGLARALFGAVGFAAAWGVFYYAGRLMLRLSSPFHEGAVWGP